MTPLVVTAAGIVPYTKDGLFLLVQNNNTDQNWCFPKGHVEEGENLITTARRELAEETGIIECEVVAGPVFTEEYSYSWQKKEIDKTVHYFLGKVDRQDVTLQAEEILDHAWLTYEEALKKITFEKAKEVLRQAQAFLDSRLT